jgi:hypothetical protein
MSALGLPSTSFPSEGCVVAFDANIGWEDPLLKALVGRESCSCIERAIQRLNHAEEV